jgi:periplasmic copper chaperone A
MMKMPYLLVLLAGFAPALSWADVTVTHPWTRATAPAQPVGGAFMTLTSDRDTALIAASSPVAKTVEIHEMKMEGNVMIMRPLPTLALPAGKPVALEPGGYHLMLMGLKQPLKEGDRVPITLVVQGKGKAKQEIRVEAEVRALVGGMHEHHHQ